MKDEPSARRNYKVIKCYGLYSGPEHGTTLLLAYIDGHTAIIRHDQEIRGLRRIRAIAGDCLACDDYEIYVISPIYG